MLTTSELQLFLEGTTLEIVLHRPFRGSPEPSHVTLGLCFLGLTATSDRVEIPRGRLGTFGRDQLTGAVGAAVKYGTSNFAFVRFEGASGGLARSNVG